MASRADVVRSAAASLMASASQAIAVPPMPVPALTGGQGGNGTASGAPVKVELTINSSGREVDNFLVNTLRKAVQVQGRGNVQVLLGGS
jgi:hypothetical protein